MMSLEPSAGATTVIIQVEPGWVIVKIAEPKPDPDRIAFLLRRTIDHWFDARPSFIIDRTEPITCDGEMLGVNVWYHVSSDQPQPVRHRMNGCSVFLFSAKEPWGEGLRRCAGALTSEWTDEDDRILEAMGPRCSPLVTS